MQKKPQKPKGLLNKARDWCFVPEQLRPLLPPVSRLASTGCLFCAHGQEQQQQQPGVLIRIKA